MEKRVLGRSGLSVSVLGLGTGEYGLLGQTTEAECVRIAHCAFDGGVTLVDTADFYSFGEAETIVGKAIAGRRDKLVVATKCGMPMSNDPNERGGSRAWIMRSVEGSLRRLGTDWIDLYQLHQPDPATDVEETLGAMNDLVRAGKVRAFGTSNHTAAQVTEAALRARLAHLVAPHSEQQAYSIFRRQPETELLPTCQKYGVGVLAYSPLNGGWLSGKYRKGREVAPTPRHRLIPGRWDASAPQNQAKVEALEALAELAAEAGLDLQHMAIGFVLAHPALTAALMGGGKIGYIESYLAGQDVRLSDDLMDRIDAIVAPGGGFDPADRGSPALAESSLRRRRPGLPKPPAAPVDFIRAIMEKERETQASS